MSEETVAHHANATEKPQTADAKRRWVPWLIALIVALVIYTNFTIFVVRPIGAIPDGVTIITFQTGKMNFVDSADGICKRTMGGVSLMCRMMILGTVASKGPIIMRLPYVESLYLISTDGATYEN